MYKILTSVILLFFFISSQTYAQFGKNRIVKQLVEDAEYLFNNARYEAAKGKLQEAIKEKPNFATAHRLLGLTYMKLGEVEAAAAEYDKVFDLQPNLSRGAYFEAGEINMKLYNYPKALEYFILYQHADPKDYKTDEQGAEFNYNHYVQRNIRSCEYSLEMGFTGTTNQPELLKGNINSKFDEFLPTLTVNGDKLLYTTTRSGDEDIMLIKQKDGEWSNARSIGNAINTDRNEGMAKFTVCGRKIYFSACAWENVQGGCDIYMAEYDVKDEIIDKVEPAQGLNSALWDSQPSISCDGRTMYFVSSREGGQGGTDIWKSELQDNGIWGPPVNMGPTINTEGDEEAPFIAPDGQTLYFASDGHPGLGESDIFRTTKHDGKEAWSTPVNMGEGINSPYREAGIVITPDGEFAYFSSARPTGKGGLDIYKNSINKEAGPKVDNVLLDGYLYDQNTKEVVEKAKIRIRSGNKNIGTFVSDKDGRFFMCVPSGASYSYIISKQGYDNFVGADYFERAAGEAVKRIDVFIKPKGGTTAEVIPDEDKTKPPTRLRKNLSVYFESGKYELSEVQKEQIRKLITQFEDKESMKIRVTGYADDVGDREFNISLSQKRAGYVTQFIKELGLDSSQIASDGKGVIESNMAKHQKRRVEIIILN
jgi:outer membrane protein OmpA-like peptidoglycan-associated protein/Tol biopolymer transport system component